MVQYFNFLLMGKRGGISSISRTMAVIHTTFGITMLTHTTASVCIMTSLLRLTMSQCTRKEVFATVKMRMPMRSSNGDEQRGRMTGRRGMNDREKGRRGRR
jgi:hypothetical protein